MNDEFEELLKQKMYLKGRWQAVMSDAATGKIDRLSTADLMDAINEHDRRCLDSGFKELVSLTTAVIYELGDE